MSAKKANKKFSSLDLWVSLGSISGDALPPPSMANWLCPLKPKTGEEGGGKRVNNFMERREEGAIMGGVVYY